jgi:hypothetical protein
MSAKLTAAGQITRTRAAALALVAAGQSAARLLIRHLRGDRGTADYTGLLAQAGDRVISHYDLPDGNTVAVVTHYPTEPTLRWTEFCLAPELAAELIELAMEETAADTEENFDPDAAVIESPNPHRKAEESMKPPGGIIDRHAR